MVPWKPGMDHQDPTILWGCCGLTHTGESCHSPHPPIPRSPPQRAPINIRVAQKSPEGIQTYFSPIMSCPLELREVTVNHKTHLEYLIHILLLPLTILREEGNFQLDVQLPGIWSMKSYLQAFSPDSVANFWNDNNTLTCIKWLTIILKINTEHLYMDCLFSYCSVLKVLLYPGYESFIR